METVVIPPLRIAPKQPELQGRPDHVVVLEKLRALLGPGVDPDQMWYLVVDGAPVSKSRARWNRKTGRTYTPAETVQAERALAARFRRVLGNVSLDGSVAIVAIFFRPNFQRIDADNLMKLVMDSATLAKVWSDDCYVTAQASFMEMDRERPRTVIAFCQTESSLDRTRMFSCVICAKDFRRSGNATFKNPPKTCSVACRQALYWRDLKPATCPKCGTDFRRQAAGQRYCSDECKAAPRKKRLPNQIQPARPRCQSCGGPVSRREYQQCSNCRPKGRPIGSKNQASLGLEAAS